MPELLTASLAAFAVASASSGALVQAALAIGCACLSRYEVWPVAATLAVHALMTAWTVPERRRWAVFGAVLDGLGGRWQTLGIKAVMDCLAMMAFVRTFRWSALASAVPVAAFLGSMTIGAKLLGPYCLNESMFDALYATTGLLVFCIALIILEFRKVELADYLPSLVWAPLLAGIWK